MFRVPYDMDDFGLITFEQDTIKAKQVLDKVAGIKSDAKENLLYLVYSSKINLEQVRSLNAEQANRFGDKTLFFDVVTTKKSFDQVKQAEFLEQKPCGDFERVYPNTGSSILAGKRRMKYFLDEQEESNLQRTDSPRPSS